VAYESKSMYFACYDMPWPVISNHTYR
jgi:hypothetical protein